MKASLTSILLLFSFFSMAQVVPNPDVQDGQSLEEEYYQGDQVAPLGSEEDMIQEEQAPAIFPDTEYGPENMEVYEDEAYEELPAEEYIEE